MIKLQSISIDEFRGIRKMTLDLKGRNFAICGRNGTGKSGVVDAIEFGLTGNISRLSGEGTDKLSVREHAPHVDARTKPEKASVTLVLSIPSLRATVTIVRSPNDPRKPSISPSTPGILSVLKQIEDHPEIVLTRREIIRYVLAPEGKRAKEVQAVLRLDDLGHIRETLRSIANKWAQDAKASRFSASTANAALAKALGITTLNETNVLNAVNPRRKTLGLSELTTLASTTSLKGGLSTKTDPGSIARISKAAATTELATFRTQIGRLHSPASDAEFQNALILCDALASDARLLKMLAREDFLRGGLEFLDEDVCPFCDDEWDPDRLRAHVAAKISALTEAKQKRTKAEEALAPIVLLLQEAIDSLDQIMKYARMAVPIPSTKSLNALRTSCERARQTLQAFLPLSSSIAILQSPPSLTAEATKELTTIEAIVNALPEASKEDASKEFLIVAQEKLVAYRNAKRTRTRLDSKAELSAKIARIYADTADQELHDLYKNVEREFAEMYGELNTPDEATFAAKLMPSIGKLGFGVNFYGRGMFPPGAYHSEGHQDAMGLCLYLALMSYVLKDGFQFAVLDDVLMSVDAGHRRAICAMLKTRFPDTQFVLTTHDPVWLNHMRTEELVTGKALIRFRSWDVTTGPAAFDDADVWTEIEKELAMDRVPIAAELLRNHLEYVTGELCHRLGARVEYRLDARVELGMLLPPAYEQLTYFLGKGKKAANSWNQKDLVGKLGKRHDELAKAYGATKADQWQMNAAIHYNAWASLQKEDFTPVALSFRQLIDQFRCPTCQSFLVRLGQGSDTRSVGCDCGQATFNLAAKDE